MTERLVTPTPEHFAFRADLIELLNKHAGHLDASDMLALASHAVGQLVAMQDQRTMTGERAMQIVARNVEVGNAEAIQALMQSEGRA